MGKTHEQYKAAVLCGRTRLQCGYRGSKCIGEVPIIDGRLMKVDLRSLFQGKKPWDLNIEDVEAEWLVLCENCVDELKSASGQRLELAYIKRVADDMANARACHDRAVVEEEAKVAAKHAKQAKAIDYLARVARIRTGNATVPFPKQATG